jgi:hypothetical protein
MINRTPAPTLTWQNDFAPRPGNARGKLYDLFSYSLVRNWANNPVVFESLLSAESKRRQLS